jgi:Domain of unknown function (DUF4124)
MVLGALAAFAAQAAVIYKWVDADGVVHYSDQAEPGAEKIYTAAPVNNAAAGPRPAAAQSPKKPPSAGMNYSQFAITSPVRDQTYYGDETIGVNLSLAPALKPDQVITWHLNGKQLSDQPSNAVSFSLPHLDRGTYAIAATITDQESGESLSTDSISFFVRQPSALSPQHKNP